MYDNIGLRSERLYIEKNFFTTCSDDHCSSYVHRHFSLVMCTIKFQLLSSIYIHICTDIYFITVAPKCLASNNVGQLRYFQLDLAILYFTLIYWLVIFSSFHHFISLFFVLFYFSLLNYYYDSSVYILASLYARTLGLYICVYI